MTVYKNPWHKPGKVEYGPTEYQTEAKPHSYRGFLIYARIPGVCWDVVREEVCVTQRAGLNGAKGAIDALLDEGSPEALLTTKEKMAKHPGANRIEYHSGPDDHNRCMFTLYWLSDYHPGHPAGENRIAERGQVFFCDPRERGFPLPPKL